MLFYEFAIFRQIVKAIYPFWDSKKSHNQFYWDLKAYFLSENDKRNTAWFQSALKK